MDVVQNPPWASELLARNRKVLRFWSLDSGARNNSNSSNIIDRDAGDVFRLNNSPSPGVQGEEVEERQRTVMKRGMTTNMKMVRDEGKVVDLPSSSSSSSAAYIRTEKSAPILDEVAEEEGAREKDDMRDYRENGEESILEYGPGIVRKLRSRYQSLALRQSVGRPILRRSTSLENCLDSVSSEQLSSDSPSPVPYYEEDEVDGDNSRGRSRRLLVRQGGIDRERENMTVNNNKSGSNNSNISNNIINRAHGVLLTNNSSRSRPAYSDYNRKDRMKRARSVDALHRPNRHDEEMLEKFRTVVSPKEEIVIIEVSKPRANISYESSNVNNYHSIIDDKFNSQQQQHLFSRSSSSSTLNNNHSYSGNSSEINRSRSVTSPHPEIEQHELPPPDIVRETARIFEKNQDNQQQHLTSHNNANGSNNNNGGNVVINNFKKVGHALRLSKSSSVSPSSSPLPSPTSNSNTITNTPMMNGQGVIGNSYHNQHLTAQGSNISTSTTTAAGHQKFKHESFQKDTKNYIVNGGVSSSFPKNTNTTTTTTCTNNKSTASSNNNSSGSSNSSNNNRQVGVIRPTITANNTVITTTSLGKGVAPKAPTLTPTISTHGGEKSASAPVTNKFSNNNSSNKVSAIDVSPILPSSNSASSTTTTTTTTTPSNNRYFHSKKPPLSPKPLFTSSPKNIFLVNNNKTGKMTESSNSSSNGNAKSPEEPYDASNVNLSFENDDDMRNDGAVSGTINRGKSPPVIVQNRGLTTTTTTTTSNSNNNGNNSSSSIVNKHIPEKQKPCETEEETVMEFQQISLKPVGLGKLNEPHSEVIKTNNDSNSNNTKNKILPNQVSSSNSKNNISSKVINSQTTNTKTNHSNNNCESKTEQKDEKSNAKGNSKQPSSSSSSTLIPNSNSTNTVVIKTKAKSDNNNTSVTKKEEVPKPKQTTVDQTSQLRAHQQQKVAQQSNNASGTMVFNFTNRQKVPDYIEDDGLHLTSSQRNHITLGGTVTDESQDDDTDVHTGSENDHVDSRLIQFEGANIIINGRSSIQKKPKSQKLNISFNEDITATFEYPSEASVLGDDTDSTDTPLGHKTPNILNNSGTGLGSYTPSKMGSDGSSYQLGNFNNRPAETKKQSSLESNKKTQQDNNELIEDYLQFKPDSGSTTWSNEIGADILF